MNSGAAERRLGRRPGVRGVGRVVTFCLSAALLLPAPLGYAMGSGGPAALRPPVQLLSLRLLPQDVALSGLKASQRLLVLGQYADGLERDVTRQSRFSVSDPDLARIDENGRLVAVKDGQVRVSAELGGLSAAMAVSIRGAQEERSFSFARNVSGIFTKRGCNFGDCHGGVKGKGGFKLSLNGINPKADYQWILEGGVYQVLTAEPGEPKVPRVNLEDPEKSKLLQKPTFAVPHGGGERLKVGSDDYAVILNWIRQGAPYGEGSSREYLRTARLEVFPQEVVLERNGSHQLLVIAHLSDGRREDMTEDVLYRPLNPEVVRVTPKGVVQAVGRGETAVLIRSAGHALSARMGVISEPIADYPDIPRENFIDDFVFAKLRKFHIFPSELSSDAEFLRRIALDLTGTLPPSRRVREFLTSKDPRKREKLIEILLNCPEYVNYWTFRFADLLRAGLGAYRAEPLLSWEWVRSSIARNKPYDQMARERIAAEGYNGPSRHFLHIGEKAHFEKLMAEEVRVFLGRRLDCAQCHDHPYDVWTQDQFWGMAAFFAKKNVTMWNAGQVVYDDPQGAELNYGEMGETSLKFIKAIHPRTKEKVEPTFLDGTVLSEEKRDDPRAAAAQWISSHPGFAETLVNRMWSYFFGRGLVNPVDDFGLRNPPTHPELLRALARDFRENGHDLKRLIRLIVRSRTYQLSSIPNETNRSDEINYSHALPRLLEAEVLLDAISAATGLPETFQDRRKTGVLAPGTRAINLTLPAKYDSRFLEIYGRPIRTTVPERDRAPNLAQALHMFVGRAYTEKLSQEGSRIDRLLERGASDRKIIDELYLATLSSHPEEEVQTRLEKMIAKKPSRRKAFEDLLWALICSREFAYNH